MYWRLVNDLDAGGGLCQTERNMETKMNIKTLLIGVVCAAYCHGLSAEEIVIADDNFQLVIVEGVTNALKSINKDATIYDLNNFAQAECWNQYVKQRLSDGGKLSNEDVQLIRFCLNVKIEMVESLACIILRDMIGPDAFDKGIKSASSECADNDGASIWMNYAAQARFMSFASNDSGIRAPMKQWASLFTNVTSDVMLKVLEDVIRAAGNVDSTSGKVSLGSIKANMEDGMWDYASTTQMLIAMGIIYAYACYDKTLTPNALMDRTQLITNRGKDICGRWTSARERIKRFPLELLAMVNVLRKQLDNENLDSGSMRLVDEILSEVEARTEYAVRMCDYVVYDLPFCILSYRALGKLKQCKGYLIDDEVKMRVVAADYADAICGTEMLKGIRTRYAASCYTEVVKFLKSELGWFTQGAFKEFVNETKLYNITLKTDETGKQDNLLETFK